MLDLTNLIRAAIDGGASDIHLTVGLPPVLRLHGRLTPQEGAPLTDEDTRSAAAEIANEEQLKILAEKGEVDFAASFKDMIRLRCNLFFQQNHIALALRLLPLRIPTAQELNLPKIVIEQAEKPRGLVLVTGPTGSGKSSTLASLLDHINHNRSHHIITFENPIEYVYKPDQCIINQREVGADTASFASGLRAALRQDPDVILVGEMRDLETISTAITAAETGHLVFGTLHTKGAASTIDRIIDSFPPEQQSQIRTQLADVLECVVAQALLPCTKGGRTAVFEVMVVTPAIRSMILQNKTFQISSAMQTGKRLGMQLLDDGLTELVQQGKVTLADAAAASDDPAAFRAHMTHVGHIGHTGR